MPMDLRRHPCGQSQSCALSFGRCAGRASSFISQSRASVWRHSVLSAGCPKRVHVRKKKKKLLQKPHEMLKILRVLRSSWKTRAVQDKAKETSRTALRVGMWTTLLICNDNKQHESQNHPFFCWWCCCFCFLGLHPRHMEVPRLGVKIEL